MTEEQQAMRWQLLQIVVHRDLCARVQKGGRSNVALALLMLFFAYIFFDPARGLSIITLVYFALALGEFAVGLFKYLHPSAESVILDGIVLVIFALFNFGVSGWLIMNQLPPNVFAIVFGALMLARAVKEFKSYGPLSQRFADRPSAEVRAWVADITSEIRHADPGTDNLALDLPTNPHWKARLIGSAAFFVELRGLTLDLVGPDEIEIERERNEHGTGRRRARMRLAGRRYPEFDIADATWDNYRKWMTANSR